MSDEELLFPSVVIKGIEIKPWSFGMLFEIGTRLDHILDKIEIRKISFSAFTTGVLSYMDMTRLFTLASSDLLEIIALTINKPVDDVKELDMATGVEIAYTIYRQNSTVIKNALTPVMATEIKANVETGEN